MKTHKTLEDIINDLSFQYLEKSRIEELKILRKTKIDYDQLLKTIPIVEIERYLRELKLKNINRNSN